MENVSAERDAIIAQLEKMAQKTNSIAKGLSNISNSVSFERYGVVLQSISENIAACAKKIK